MSDIYEQHAAAFNRVSAFVILKGAERVATVAIKFPADSAGRLYAYVHYFGHRMFRGFANGGGYDKRSAAVSAAACWLPLACSDDATYLEPAQIETRKDFRNALENVGGQDWTRALEQAGFTVLQAV